MNLKKLFELQKELDERIEQEHPRQEGEDRLAKKILALQVELGELANEWRGFKYWSYDREPRTVMYRQAKNNDGRPTRGLEKYNPLLEEYVDCLHFLLSIGNDLGLSNQKFLKKDNQFVSTLEAFRYCFNWVVNLDYVVIEDGRFDFKMTYKHLLTSFVWLGEMLGFAWEEVEQAYMKKNAVNFERQENGY